MNIPILQVLRDLCVFFVLNVTKYNPLKWFPGSQPFKVMTVKTKLNN